MRDTKYFALFGAIILCAGLSGCEQPAPPNEQAADSVASSPVTPKPEDIINANTPKAELDLGTAHAAFQADVDAPNNIVRDEIQDKKAKVWKEAVLHIGKMENWSGSVYDIRDDGRITLDLPNGLRVWADVPANGKLYNVIRTLSDKTKQPVYFSGRLNQTNIDSTESSNDSNFPTCFEDAMGISGCEIDIDSIQPIQAVD